MKISFWRKSSWVKSIWNTLKKIIKRFHWTEPPMRESQFRVLTQGGFSWMGELAITKKYGFKRQDSLRRVMVREPWQNNLVCFWALCAPGRIPIASSRSLPDAWIGPKQLLLSPQQSDQRLWLSKGASSSAWNLWPSLRSIWIATSALCIGYKTQYASKWQDCIEVDASGKSKILG